tara:strand:+ start:569 stop:862 length:294 start_codon:yes stop_codon:yes gene_type:complete
MKPLTKTEVKELERKLALPTVRKGPKKQVVPTKLSEREFNFLVFVMLKPMRESNLKKFGGGIQKNWNKMSKSERAEEMQKSRLKRGEGTTGSRPMNV